MKTTLRNALLATVSLIAPMGVSMPAHAAAPSDILFILDGSGSMWGQIDGVAKIDTAKATLGKLLYEVPSDARLGLVTYGDRDEKSCQDVTYANPLGSSADDIKASIDKLTPLGKTPIDTALGVALARIAEAEPFDVKKSIVLVSDGIETCDGDPCDTAALVEVNGVDLKVHVVGFNVDAEARKQLECIAEKGGGQYFDAADAKGFQEAMASVVKVAQAAPEPVAAPAKPLFEDDFDGEDLSQAWQVLNEDADGYIVEDGSLLMATSKVQGFGAGEPSNLVTFDQDLPKGDCDMTMRVKFDGQTGRDSIWFGLYTDPQNFLAIHYHNVSSHCARTVLQLVKMAKGEEAKFDARTSGMDYCGQGIGDTTP